MRGLSRWAAFHRWPCRQCGTLLAALDEVCPRCGTYEPVRLPTSVVIKTAIIAACLIGATAIYLL